MAMTVILIKKFDLFLFTSLVFCYCCFLPFVTVVNAIPGGKRIRNNNNNNNNDDDAKSRRKKKDSPILEYFGNDNDSSSSTTISDAVADAMEQSLNERSSVESSSQSSTTTSRTTNEHQDVIIIGAGWAGITAGYELIINNNRNLKVTIFEANNRIGGRTHTITDFIPGLPIEKGSEWTYEDNDTFDLIQSIGQNYGVTKSEWEDYAVYVPTNGNNGQNSLLDERSKMNYIEKTWEDGYLKFMKNRLRNTRSDTNYGQICSEFQTSDETADFTDLETKFYLSMAANEIETEYSGDLDDTSVAETSGLLSELYDMLYMGVPGGGFRNVLMQYAEPIQDHIWLNNRVTNIQYGSENHNGAATVSYVDASGNGRTMTANTVLMTVSLGVLKNRDISFIPSLPPEKINAIDTLGFGNLNKCIMYWEDKNQATTWWPHDQTWLVLVPENENTIGKFTIFFNMWDHQGNNGKPLLSGWIGGNDANAMEQLSDEQILEQNLANLRSMFGNVVPQPTKYLISRWGQEEYIRGAYSFPMAGTDSNRLRRTLQETTNDNLFWAGEAMESEWYATTVGAQMTGQNAANEISRYLNNDCGGNGCSAPLNGGGSFVGNGNGGGGNTGGGGGGGNFIDEIISSIDSAIIQPIDSAIISPTISFIDGIFSSLFG